MSVVLKNITNCLWHAFNALQQQSTGLVHKSKLKVLTANIGTILDLYGVEKGLDHYRSATELNFEQYKYYLQQEVFASLSDKANLSELREFESKIEEVFWLVCRGNSISREHKFLPDSTVFQLFRIFCLLADLTPDPSIPNAFQVILHSSEACLIVKQLVVSLGLSWDPSDWENLCETVEHYRWNTFISVVESKYCRRASCQLPPIIEAIDEMFQTYIKDVIKKGYLMKRGFLLPTMKEYWFVLQPCQITYFKTHTENFICGTISLDPSCSVDARSQHQGKVQKLFLSTPERTFELGTSDHKTRLQWSSALQLAIEHSGGRLGYQRGQRTLRLLENERRELQVHEAKRAKRQLQVEIKARIAAEAQAKEMTLIAEKDNKQLCEMRVAQVALQKLLEEETQAKRDEEIVRALQARILAEEWEKREELERIQEEQQQLLEMERLKRKQFQLLQAEKEAQFKDAQERLAQLETERQRLDDELKLAQNKMKYTEEAQKILEDQLMDLYHDDKEDYSLRRTMSSPNSTVIGENSKAIFKDRAATLKKHKGKENHTSDGNST